MILQPSKILLKLFAALAALSSKKKMSPLLICQDSTSESMTNDSTCVTNFEVVLRRRIVDPLLEIETLWNRDVIDGRGVHRIQLSFKQSRQD